MEGASEPLQWGTNFGISELLKSLHACVWEERISESDVYELHMNQLSIDAYPQKYVVKQKNNKWKGDIVLGIL